MFSKLRRVSQDAEEGVNDLMTRLVCGGMDQWPDPGEAWGELDHCRQMLDFKGFVSELNSVDTHTACTLMSKVSHAVSELHNCTDAAGDKLGLHNAWHNENMTPIHYTFVSSTSFCMDKMTILGLRWYNLSHI